MSAIDVYHDNVLQSYTFALGRMALVAHAGNLTPEDVDKLLHGRELDRLYAEAATAVAAHPLADRATVALDEVRRHYSEFWRFYAFHTGRIPATKLDWLDRFCDAIDDGLEELRKYRSVESPALASNEPEEPEPIGGSVNLRMIDALQRRPESKDWSIRQWQSHLGSASLSTIQGTPTWKALIESRAAAKEWIREGQGAKDDRGRIGPRTS